MSDPLFASAVQMDKPYHGYFSNAVLQKTCDLSNFLQRPAQIRTGFITFTNWMKVKILSLAKAKILLPIDLSHQVWATSIISFLPAIDDSPTYTSYTNQKVHPTKQINTAKTFSDIYFHIVYKSDQHVHINGRRSNFRIATDLASFVDIQFLLTYIRIFVRECVRV